MDVENEGGSISVAKPIVVAKNVIMSVPKHAKTVSSSSPNDERRLYSTAKHVLQDHFYGALPRDSTPPSSASPSALPSSYSIPSESSSHPSPYQSPLNGALVSLNAASALTPSSSSATELEPGCSEIVRDSNVQNDDETLRLYRALREKRRLFDRPSSSPESTDREKKVEDAHHRRAERINRRQSTSSFRSKIYRNRPPRGTACCLLETDGTLWKSCERRAFRPLTRLLQITAREKDIPLAVDQDKRATLYICLFHRRQILSGRRTGIFDDDEELLMEYAPETAAEFFHLDLSPQELVMSRVDAKEEWRRDELSDENELLPQWHRGSEWEEALDDRHADSDGSGYSNGSAGLCIECGPDPNASCNAGRDRFPVTTPRVRRRGEKEERRRRREEILLANERHRHNADEDYDDDDDDDEHPLAVLSAAALRRYRKQFDIPTKVSATKHAMLEGVIGHFERMPADAGEAIAHFLAAAECREKNARPELLSASPPQLFPQKPSLSSLSKGSNSSNSNAPTGSSLMPPLANRTQHHQNGSTAPITRSRRS